jgi:hypothetical protein
MRAIQIFGQAELVGGAVSECFSVISYVTGSSVMISHIIGSSVELLTFARKERVCGSRGAILPKRVGGRCVSVTVGDRGVVGEAPRVEGAFDV